MFSWCWRNVLPFPDTGCPVRYSDKHYLYDTHVYLAWNVWDTVSIFIHLPKMYLSMDIIPEQRILDNLSRTSFTSDSQTKLRIINKTVTSVEADSICDVLGVDEPLAFGNVVLCLFNMKWLTYGILSLYLPTFLFIQSTLHSHIP